MRVSQILFEAPGVTASGANIRNIALCRALSALGEVQTLHVQSYGPNETWHPSRGSSYVDANFGANLINRIISDVLSTKPDVITVEGVYLAEIADALLAQNLPVIIDMHNVESKLREQIDRKKGGSIKQYLSGLRNRNRWRRASRREAQLAQAASAVWVCSSSDATLLKEIAPNVRQIDIVPNPVPMIQSHQRCFDNWTPNAVFVGHLGYEPNVHAARELIDEIFPAIQRQFPEATLTIAGRNPHRSVIAKAQSNARVKLVANPQSLDPIYSAANLALVPLRLGGGTRLKVLEAMSNGLPVVASQKAVEGLDISDGEQFFCGESTGDFVEKIARLASEPELGHQITNAARKFVHENHSETVILNAVSRSIERLNTSEP